jgi:hypothetical protein
MLQTKKCGQNYCGKKDVGQTVHRQKMWMKHAGSKDNIEPYGKQNINTRTEFN